MRDQEEEGVRWRVDGGGGGPAEEVEGLGTH